MRALSISHQGPIHFPWRPYPHPWRPYSHEGPIYIHEGPIHISLWPYSHHMRALPTSHEGSIHIPQGPYSHHMGARLTLPRAPYQHPTPHDGHIHHGVPIHIPRESHLHPTRALSASYEGPVRLTSTLCEERRRGSCSTGDCIWFCL